MIRLLPFVLLLAACGVDGAPSRPTGEPATRVTGSSFFGWSSKDGLQQGVDLELHLGG